MTQTLNFSDISHFFASCLCILLISCVLLQKMGKKNKQVLGKSIIKQRTKSGGNIKHANSWVRI